jgi:CubicO group peptidase (beta-lactamase class C family)
MTTTINPTPPSPSPPQTTVSNTDELVADPAMAGQHQSESEVEGICTDAFSRVRDAFLDMLTSGQDIGASVALLVDGEVVVDLWGGYFDATYTRRFPGDALVQGFSSTKTMTALCALLLADRGELDLDAPVCEYWPEFAAAGKERVLVRHLLGHTSGLAGWTEHMTLDDIFDSERSTAMLAAQAPWWEPGTVSGYHTVTFGHLVGEVVRRVSGKPLGTFLSDEILAPLGVETDYYIGTPEHCDGRVSLLIPGHEVGPKGSPYFTRSALNPVMAPTDTWRINWRRAVMGGVNGHGNARGIATAQSVVASGGAGGVRLMSDTGRERVLEQQAFNVDLVLNIPLRWGMGYSLNNEIVPASGGTRVAWWGGNGGSMSFVDLDRRFSFGYVPNRWITGAREMDRSMRLLNEVYLAL